MPEGAAMPVSSPPVLTKAGWSWHPLGDRGELHLTPPIMRANARAACGHPLFTGRGWRRPSQRGAALLPRVPPHEWRPQVTVALPTTAPPGRRAFKLRWVKVEAATDVVTLVREDELAGEAVAIYLRVHMALSSVREVWTGEACLTRVGAAYLGVPYQPLSREAM